MSESEEIKVVQWVHRDDTSRYKSIGWMGGFVENDTTWKEYVECFDDSARPYLEAVRRDVLEKQLRLTGEEHQNSNQGVPVFNDGVCMELSWRAWGDLMAAIWNSAGERRDYMDYYM